MDMVRTVGSRGILDLGRVPENRVDVENEDVENCRGFGTALWQGA